MKQLIVLGLLVFSMFVVGLPTEAHTQEQAKQAQVTRALSTPVGKQIKAAVEKYSVLYKIDKELVYAVILTESSFNTRAVSSHGCSGLMQLAPATFRARNVGNNIFDIDQNIHGGVKHLRGLYDRYRGDEVRMLAAYNYGGGRIFIGKPIPQGAQHYVNKVYAHKKVIQSITL